MVRWKSRGCPQLGQHKLGTGVASGGAVSDCPLFSGSTCSSCWRNGDNGYGYQWWSIKAGDYRYNLAWGHGGQQIVLVDDLDMMIVLLVDPLHMQWGDEPWGIEKANLN